VPHVVIKLLAVFTAVRIGKNISTARIAFDSTHEWHVEEQKNRASVKDHHRPFWPSKVFRRRLLGLLRTKPLGQYENSAPRQLSRLPARTLQNKLQKK